MKLLFIGIVAIMSAAAGTAWAQVGCVPNPNVNGPPYIDGCSLPASGLNKLLNSSSGGNPGNAGNFVTDTAPFQSINPTVSNAFIAGVMGTTSTPNTTTDFEAIFQKVGTQTSSATIGGAILGSLVASSTAAAAHGTAIVGLAQSAVNYTGALSSAPFIEGTRGECNLISPGANTQCNGISGEVNFWTSKVGAFGIEGADNNNTGTDSSATFSATNFDAAFIASCGDHGAITGASKCQTAFLVNPNAFPLPQLSFRYGFYIPSNSSALTVDTAAFRSDVPSATGLDLEGVNTSYYIKTATGFRAFGTGEIGLGEGQPATYTHAAVVFYEGAGTGSNWDQGIQGINGTGAQGTGYLAMTTGGLRLIGSWLQIGTGSGLASLNAGEIGLTKNGSTLTAPGAGFLKLFVQAGTGTACNLVALAGTSTTPVVVATNVGSGC